MTQIYINALAILEGRISQKGQLIRHAYDADSSFYLNVQLEQLFILKRLIMKRS